MELTQRQREILLSLVKIYISTGEPVGSKAILNVTGMPVSSATVRNELSYLDENGYIFQPHTSAGRVPTNKGYDFYVHYLMDNCKISDDIKNRIDSLLSNAAKDPENFSSVAGQILSDLTGYTTVVGTIMTDDSYVKRVETFPMGRRTILILLVTSDGLARSRICISRSELNDSLLDQFAKTVSSEITGKPLNSFSKAFLQNIVATVGLNSLSLSPLLSSVFEMITDIREKSLNVKGQSNLVNISGNEYDINGILKTLNQRDLMNSILKDIPQPVSIVYGDKSGIDVLKASNMIVAKFRLDNHDIGRLGIIGPTRMQYDAILPEIKYFADRLGDIMSKAISDLDE